MAAPTVFVSSTFYDLRYIRENLSRFVAALGWVPILSEEGTVFFNPATDVAVACVRDVPEADLFVLIIGGRVGSLIPGTPQSVTNGEYQEAVRQKIPIFALVEQGTYNDYKLYRANAAQPDLLQSLRFPNADNLAIFDFIEEVESREANNALVTFRTYEDIEHYLRSQWAGMVHSLLAGASNGDRELAADEAEGKIELGLTTLVDDAKLLPRFHEASDVRIFASGTGTYHHHLRTSLGLVQRTRPMRIQVLARDDGSIARRAELRRALSKWRELELLYPYVTVHFRARPLTFDFRGIVWDEEAAAIGWYERRDGTTRGQEFPVVFVENTTSIGERFLHLLIDRFDASYAEASTPEDWNDQPARTVIFDLDGTLYDSTLLDEENHQALIDALAVGRSIASEDAAALVDNERRSDEDVPSLAAVGRRLGVDPELLGKHQMERIQPEKHLQPDPVLVDLLQRMKHYVTLGVLTNVGRGVAMRILATLGLAEDDFAVIMAAGDLEHPKPSTADLVRAVKAASGDVRYSVVVGDRAHVDIVPGLELGMETVLVPGRDDVVAWLRRELEHFEPGNRL